MPSNVIQIRKKCKKQYAITDVICNVNRVDQRKNHSMDNQDDKIIDITLLLTYMN